MGTQLFAGTLAKENLRGENLKFPRLPKKSCVPFFPSELLDEDIGELDGIAVVLKGDGAAGGNAG